MAYIMMKNTGKIHGNLFLKGDYLKKKIDLFDSMLCNWGHRREQNFFRHALLRFTQGKRQQSFLGNLSFFRACYKLTSKRKL